MDRQNPQPCYLHLAFVFRKQGDFKKNKKILQAGVAFSFIAS